MKKSELLPTPGNIRETFLSDTIKRNQDVISFIKLIDSINESYSIALDSQWGSGKNFLREAGGNVVKLVKRYIL